MEKNNNNKYRKTRIKSFFSSKKTFFLGTSKKKVFSLERPKKNFFKKVLRPSSRQYVIYTSPPNDDDDHDDRGGGSRPSSSVGDHHHQFSNGAPGDSGILAAADSNARTSSSVIRHPRAPAASSTCSGVFTPGIGRAPLHRSQFSAIWLGFLPPCPPPISSISPRRGSIALSRCRSSGGGGTNRQHVQSVPVANTIKLTCVYMCAKGSIPRRRS